MESGLGIIEAILNPRVLIHLGAVPLDSDIKKLSPTEIF